jgi:poly(ADP-ribose) glycohydrolase
MIYREITKAYCGFSFEEVEGRRIVSGNWGCGAFGGHIQLKFMIQWIACTLARRELVYCPFGSSQQLADSYLFKSLKEMRLG